MPVRLLLAGRACDGVAAETAIIETEEVGVAYLLAACALFYECVSLGFVAEPHLAPLLRPMILVQAGEPRHDPLDVVAAHALERAVVRSPAQDFFPDFVQRALASLRCSVHDQYSRNAAGSWPRRYVNRFDA